MTTVSWIVIGGLVACVVALLLFVIDTRRKTHTAFKRFQRVMLQETGLLEQFNERIVALEVTEVERSYLFGADVTTTSSLAAERYRKKYPDRHFEVKETRAYGGPGPSTQGSEEVSLPG